MLAAWDFIDPILYLTKDMEVQLYRTGTMGPEDKILTSDGYQWLDPERRIVMNVSKLIIEKLNTAIERDGKASLVVSGGSSPISIYEELSNADIPWSKVFLTLVDDRLVEPNHEDSNQNLLYEHLIKNKAKEVKFFPLDEGVRFNKEFKKPFDITLLGMGEDGHLPHYFLI